MAVEIQAANRLVASEKWSHDVHTKKHPPEGKFADGSAESIAEWAERSHNGNIGKAIQSISSRCSCVISPAASCRSNSAALIVYDTRFL